MARREAPLLTPLSSLHLSYASMSSVQQEHVRLTLYDMDANFPSVPGQPGCRFHPFLSALHASPTSSNVAANVDGLGLFLTAGDTGLEDLSVVWESSTVAAYYAKIKAKYTRLSRRETGSPLGPPALGTPAPFASLLPEAMGYAVRSDNRRHPFLVWGYLQLDPRSWSDHEIRAHWSRVAFLQLLAPLFACYKLGGCRVGISMVNTSFIRIWVKSEREVVVEVMPDWARRFDWGLSLLQWMEHDEFWATGAGLPRRLADGDPRNLFRHDISVDQWNLDALLDWIALAFSRADAMVDPDPSVALAPLFTHGGDEEAPFLWTVGEPIPPPLPPAVVTPPKPFSLPKPPIPPTFNPATPFRRLSRRLSTILPLPTLRRTSTASTAPGTPSTPGTPDSDKFLKPAKLTPLVYEGAGNLKVTPELGRKVNELFPNHRSSELEEARGKMDPRVALVALGHLKVSFKPVSNE